MENLCNSTKMGFYEIKVLNDDIADLGFHVDAIVNSADGYLRSETGVSKSILSKGGEDVAKECKEYIDLLGSKMEVADIVSTTAGNLDADIIIHVVGPNLRSNGSVGFDGEDILADCYRVAIDLANNRGCKSIAFPCISTGAKGFPKEEAVKTAVFSVVKSMRKYNHSIETVYFVCGDEENFSLYLDEVGQVAEDNKQSLLNIFTNEEHFAEYMEDKAKELIEQKVKYIEDLDEEIYKERISQYFKGYEEGKILREQEEIENECIHDCDNCDYCNEDGCCEYYDFDEEEIENECIHDCDNCGYCNEDGCCEYYDFDEEEEIDFNSEIEFKKEKLYAIIDKLVTQIDNDEIFNVNISIDKSEEFEDALTIKLTFDI